MKTISCTYGDPFSLCVLEACSGLDNIGAELPPELTERKAAYLAGIDFLVRVFSDERMQTVRAALERRPENREKYGPHVQKLSRAASYGIVPPGF